LLPVPTPFRALLAAIIVAAAAYGGAVAVNAQSGAADLTPPLVLNFDNGNSDRGLIAHSIDRVEKTYYKPVDPQTLLDGEHKMLVDFLAKNRKVAAPQVPIEKATGDRTHDIDAALAMVTSAEKKYTKKATDKEFTEVALSGLMSSLGDPYTVYLTKNEIDLLQEGLKGGAFGGIGIYIIQDKYGDTLADPIEGNPALKAGVKPGDIIDTVNGKKTVGLKLDSIEDLIRGPIGSQVTLTVHHQNFSEKTGAKLSAGPERSVAITRAQVYVPSVKAKMEDGYAYVRLSDFGSNSYDEVKKAFEAAKAKGAKGYILDLRNNGGGYLDAAVDISSLFIKDGPIVTQIDRNGDRDVKDATGDFGDFKPLAILVNKYTASASEITAGAVQDDGVGTLVGTKTFGKGVVQSIYALEDGGALKITTARYVTPKGRDIHHKGIIPDVVVPQPADDPRLIDTSKDKQLAAAKAVLAKKVAAQ
jgi:carboxyl-terminal processing protease